MKTVFLEKPISLRPSDITENTSFIVKKDLGNEFAVTINGDWKSSTFSDRADGLFPWPAIHVECEYQSKGVLLNRIDNADITAIRVHESRGCGVELRSVRQSQINSIRVHRAKSDDLIVRIDGIDNADASNMILIGQLSCMACDAPVTVSIEGTGKNSPRVITISQLILHVVVDRIREQFPPMANVGGRKRVHVRVLDRSAAVTIVSGNLRLDPADMDGSKAIEMASTCRDIVMLNGQILKAKYGEDVVSMVDGGLKVIPWAGDSK